MTVTTGSIPEWLTACSWVAIGLGLLCALVLAVDIARHPQPMAVMNLVWPICALFGSVIWVVAYVAWGRAAPRTASHPASTGDDTEMDMTTGRAPTPRPMASSVFVGTSHCGAGCTLADLAVEWLLFAAPGIAVVGGLGWAFSDELFAGWVLAYVAALVIGIAFQYFAIAPMNRERGRVQNLRAAARADILSLTAWQVGMYGAMAVAQLGLVHG